MQPEHLRFGGGVSQTVLNPLVLIVVLIAGLLMCFLPRNKVIVPFLAASILIPMDHVLLIGSFHFPMLRLLILFGILRFLKEKAFSHRPLFSGGMNKIDVAVIWLTVLTAVDGVLLFRESGALIKQVGDLYTVFGVYFIMRFLIRDEEDVVRTLRTFAYVAAVVALVMTYEQATGHNPYALLGGARATVYADLMERGDHFRATACFGHPILAGTFGAILVPVFVALWWKGGKNRKIAMMGIIAATVITVTSVSSTPIAGYAAGVGALCLWPLRTLMRPIRWGIGICLVSLHMVMKAPVWQLMARVDLVGGSSADHRYQLVNQFILHFWDWWLVGVKDTGAWGWSMWDTANQYVAIGAYSGLLPFAFFVAIIVYGFKYLGAARKTTQGDKRSKLVLWALGSALFANIVAFFGISYFDQIQVAWYGLLSIISAAVTVAHRVAAPEPQLQPALHSPDASFEFAFADRAAHVPDLAVV